MSNKNPVYKKLERTEKLFYKDTLYAADTASAAIKNSITTNFIIPFAIAMHTPNEFIAAISSVPHMIGSFFQLFVADMLNVVRNRKTIIAITAAIDSFMWIPILLIPFIWNSNPFLLLNFLIVQAIALAILRPFYNSLLADVIPKHKRGSVIGRINKISGTVSFVSTIIFGVILSILKPYNPYLGFAVIFLLAFVSRAISATIKSKYYEPSSAPQRKIGSLLKFSKNIRKTNFGNFVLYSSLINFALGLSSPFFPVYMLTQLRLSFLTYSIIYSASIISSLAVLNNWGRELDKNGSKWMLSVSGFLIPWLPIIWIFFKSPFILILVQLASGAIWSAYKLAISNFVLDATDRSNRLIMNSYYNFFIGSFTFVGSMMGAFLIKVLPTEFMGNVFYFIFGLSGVLRFFISLFFIPNLKEERFVNIELKGPKARRIISIMPQQGVDYEFIPRK